MRSLQMGREKVQLPIYLEAQHNYAILYKSVKQRIQGPYPRTKSCLDIAGFCLDLSKFVLGDTFAAT